MKIRIGNPPKSIMCTIGDLSTSEWERGVGVGVGVANLKFAGVGVGVEFFSVRLHSPDLTPYFSPLSHLLSLS